MGFGKYKGMCYEQIILTDWGYCKWAEQNLIKSELGLAVRHVLDTIRDKQDPNRTCCGMCLLGVDLLDTKPNEKCPEKCAAIPCLLCRDLMPEVIAKEGKYCINCHVMKYCAESEGKRWAPREIGILNGTHCRLCSGPLVAVGTSRMNGASHSDWYSRKEHKQCWLRAKKERDYCDTHPADE